DLDIVLMDCSRPFGNGRLLPAGRLRENPYRAIERADIIVFTRYSGDESYKEIVNNYKNTGNVRYKNAGKAEKIFFTTCHRPFLYSFSGINKKIISTLEDLKGRKASLFSGIADNLSFRKTVEKLGVPVKAHLEFNDNHMYKDDEISMILETSYRSGADMIVTTEKDYSRLGRALLERLKVMDFGVIGVEIDFLDNAEEFMNIIKNRLNRNLQKNDS
ncbi:MAG: tetraacyldisaccharide 4'-kinase, partial [Desulfamplus sp.]|nr:tetraacyldisaccharide 4'-kinase [Desulfamplus sp.]